MAQALRISPAEVGGEVELTGTENRLWVVLFVVCDCCVQPWMMVFCTSMLTYSGIWSSREM
jgi:hypothetical protein